VVAATAVTATISNIETLNAVSDQSHTVAANNISSLNELSTVAAPRDGSVIVALCF